jgi:aminoglycoside phosphotransferase family enzyme/predicted kinase
VQSPSAIPIADLIAALQQADAYPEPSRAPIEVVQTHISVLFLTDSRVYKVKKPIKLDFLDYSTLERRRHFCEEEVRLNSRLASQIYLGVTSIVRSADGVIRVGAGHDGEVSEYAVEMVRLPAERMMSAMLDRGEIDNQQVDRIVDVLVRFHRDSASGPGVDEYALPEEIAAQAEENLAALDQSIPRILSRFLGDRLRKALRTWLADRRDLLLQRVHDGRIREGHGDLHAGNICLLKSGIVIYDCIEFSRRFRCRDVACELAFLAMDLDVRGFRDFSGYLLRQYAQRTNDPQLHEAAAFYQLHLAIVRCKVASLRASDAGLDHRRREEARREAMRYIHLAAAYTLQPSLILMCGLPATGKSFAARAIAQPCDAVVLRSDVVRKALAGAAPQTRGADQIESGMYSARFTQRTYSALSASAAEHLRNGKSVVIDATFQTAALRRPFFEAAAELGVPCILVELTCPEDVIRQRMVARTHDATEVSDADWRVYQHAKSRFESPTEIPATQRVQLDCRLTPEDITSAVIHQVIQQAAMALSMRRRH